VQLLSGKTVKKQLMLKEHAVKIKEKHTKNVGSTGMRHKENVLPVA
jgi:hypothetical protein